MNSQVLKGEGLRRSRSPGYWIRESSAITPYCYHAGRCLKIGEGEKGKRALLLLHADSLPCDSKEPQPKSSLSQATIGIQPVKARVQRQPQPL
jgi:hypothetical protein